MAWATNERSELSVRVVLFTLWISPGNRDFVIPIFLNSLLGVCERCNPFGAEEGGYQLPRKFAQIENILLISLGITFFIFNFMLLNLL